MPACVLLVKGVGIGNKQKTCGGLKKSNNSLPGSAFACKARNIKLDDDGICFLPQL